MSQIILDFGSGNTCRNDPNIIKRMIDEIVKIDTKKHSIVLKWQLFERAGENKPLDHSVFRMAYYYAEKHGYKTTASVFDLSSLRYLLKFNIPFVKIANNRLLDWLIGEVPRKIPVYVSVGNIDDYITYTREGIEAIACVSKYPATLKDYENTYKSSLGCELQGGCVSDHTVGLELFKKYQPEIFEKHYKLSDSTGLDAGPFAITPEELREIIGEKVMDIDRY